MKKTKQEKKIIISLKKEDANNLYRPSSEYELESFALVHVKEGYQKKLSPVLLKEWFWILSPGGSLILEYDIDKEVTFTFVEQQLWWLFKGNYDITEHTLTKTRGRIVVKKRFSQFSPNDSIEKWTFGIITNGERDDWMEEIIASIRALKIPQYEIIVCGKYRTRKESDFVYINFNERAERGWITKKKNLICERAKYENLCIIHDRLIFDKDWYKGIKQYGNAFEFLGCMQIDKNTGEQAGDWLTHGAPIEKRYRIARLAYRDWDYYIYLSGQLTILKKSIWEKVLWDETRYWGEEDVDISFRARDLGYIIRFNPFAKVAGITWRHGKLPLQYDRSQGLLPKDMLLRRIMRFPMQILHGNKTLFMLIDIPYKYFSKTALYKYLVYH